MKQTFKERLADAKVRRVELEANIDGAITKLHGKVNKSQRLAARRLILGAYDGALYQDSLVDAGHPISPDVWAHFEKIADLSNELADLSLKARL
jgi:hypothetical protein